MTLRLRLVLALMALLAVGLGVFGLTTNRLYARSQYQRLDDQLRSSVSGVARELAVIGGIEPGRGERSGNGGPPDRGGAAPDGGGRGAPGNGPVLVDPSTYAELRNGSGDVLATLEPDRFDARPDVSDLRPPGSDEVEFTTVESTGSGPDWRVATQRLSGPLEVHVVVARPLSPVSDALTELVVIELLVAGAVLLVLGGGAWLILRRELRPLEKMATTAGTIAGGDLEQRVAPAEDRTEIGQLGLALNTMLDEIEAAFAERDATEQRLRRFLADASHELRTPLTSIQGFAELVRLGADQDRVQLETILRRIEEESTRMARLVEDLLMLARLDEVRPFEPTPVDLTVLAADACSDLVAVAPDRQVTLDAPRPVVVSGDEDHLRQALSNLFTNAARHTPSATSVEVSALLDGSWGVVTVRDHGPGVGPDALDHVFDRFWQADTARVGTGAGLGLAIVAGIAHEHGGTAAVHNEPDGGARFTLRVPITQRGCRLVERHRCVECGTAGCSAKRRQHRSTRHRAHDDQRDRPAGVPAHGCCQVERPEPTKVLADRITGYEGQTCSVQTAERPEPQVQDQAVGVGGDDGVGPQQNDLGASFRGGKTGCAETHPSCGQHLERQPRANSAGDQRRGEQRRGPEHESEAPPEHPARRNEQEEDQLQAGNSPGGHPQRRARSGEDAEHGDCLGIEPASRQLGHQDRHEDGHDGEQDPRSIRRVGQFGRPSGAADERPEEGRHAQHGSDRKDDSPPGAHRNHGPPSDRPGRQRSSHVRAPTASTTSATVSHAAGAMIRAT